MRLVLGQQACKAKSNEITAIPLLLERLALTGALVTIDAIASWRSDCEAASGKAAGGGTQTKIAQAILDWASDDLLAVKDNQPSLHDKIRRYFDHETPRFRASARRPTATTGASRSVAIGSATSWAG